MRSPLQSTQIWYDLTAVAEAAPVEFLRDGWVWFVETCEQFHATNHSMVLYEYDGWLSELDPKPNHPESTIPAAFSLAVNAVAKSHQDEFVQITKGSWKSQNAVVHRLIAQGLRLVADRNPRIGLEYLSGDPRRFVLGDTESHRASDSTALVAALAKYLPKTDLPKLIDLIRKWSRYRDNVEIEECQNVWDREARLRLLDAIPPDRRDSELAAFIESEKVALPNWDEKHIHARSGWVRRIPPITKEAMLAGTDDEIINAINTAPITDAHNRQWVGTEGGWEEPGGDYEVAQQIAELSKEHAERAYKIVDVMIDKGKYDIAAHALSQMSDANISDDQVFNLVRKIASFDKPSEELRSSLGYLLYKRCDPTRGLPDDICNILRKFLSLPWDHDSAVVGEEKSQTDEKHAYPLLWSDANDFGAVNQSFFCLLALTYGYLMRSPPESTKWLDFLEEHLTRDVPAKTWAAYCMELKWIRIQGCDRQRGAGIVKKLFDQLPSLIENSSGMQLVAMVADLLPKDFLKILLDAMRTSQNAQALQGYGELITLFAFRDQSESAKQMIGAELQIFREDKNADSVATGIAFAAARLWDNPKYRKQSADMLCRLIPFATDRVIQGIQTVFFAAQTFAVEDATRRLLGALSQNPSIFKTMNIVDLTDHLVNLVVHEPVLVLGVCEAIVLKSGRDETRLFEVGPHLVTIAITLQRTNATRDAGLVLFEHMLRLGLDDALAVLSDIDIRPSLHSVIRTPARRRRIRQTSG